MAGLVRVCASVVPYDQYDRLMFRFEYVTGMLIKLGIIDESDVTPFKVQARRAFSRMHLFRMRDIRIPSSHSHARRAFARASHARHSYTIRIPSAHPHTYVCLRSTYMATCENPLSTWLTWKAGAPGGGAPRFEFFNMPGSYKNMVQHQSYLAKNRR